VPQSPSGSYGPYRESKFGGPAHSSVTIFSELMGATAVPYKDTTEDYEAAFVTITFVATRHFEHH